MGKIYIKDLVVFAYHGVLKEEKVLGQKFLISIDLSLDLTRAARSKNLTDTVSYADVVSFVETEFTRESFDLIETAADELARKILFNFDLVDDVKILVKKPWAPIHSPMDTVAVEVSRKWERVFLSLGTNVGERKENLDRAIEALKENENIKDIKKSSYIETKAWGIEDQDDFLNACVSLQTVFEAEELLEHLKDLEGRIGRIETYRWGPRLVDLDILFYGDKVIYQDNLQIPHPYIQDRMFVLEPLFELAEHFIHPVIKKSIRQLKNELSERA